MNNIVFLAIPIIMGLGVGLFLANTFSEESNSEPVLLSAKNLIQGGSPMIGDPNAPVTILEWGDYQCTFCYRFHQSSLEIIDKEYIQTGKVNLVFKDFPLNGPDSVLAAEAAYCANDQGKYWQYHDELYNNWGGERTGWVNRDSLNQFAQTVGLNLDEFNLCLDGKKYNQKILDLYKFGQNVGIEATPSFLIFDDEKIIKIRGNQPVEVFKRVIQDFN